MDFFERTFHIALDGGNSSIELRLFLGVIMLCISAVWRKPSQRNGVGE
jgi:hypothetical protein